MAPSCLPKSLQQQPKWRVGDVLGGKKEPARQFHLGVGVPAQLLKCPAEKEYTAQLSPPLAIERVLARRSGNNNNNKIFRNYFS